MCHLLDHRDDPVPSTWTQRKIFQHVHFASRNMPNLKIDIISVPSHGKHPLWKCPASVNVTICRLGNAAADQAATTANAFAMEALQVSIDESKNRQTWMASSLDFLPLACFRNWGISDAHVNLNLGWYTQGCTVVFQRQCHVISISSSMAARRGACARFETHIEPNPIRAVSQPSKASCKPPKRTFRHTEAAGDESGEASYKYDAPSARELPANEGEQAADDASLSRALPPAMATAGYIYIIKTHILLASKFKAYKFWGCKLKPWFWPWPWSKP